MARRDLDEGFHSGEATARDDRCVRLLMDWAPGPDGRVTCHWRLASTNPATVRLAREGPEPDAAPEPAVRETALAC